MRITYDGGKLLYIADLQNAKIRQVDLASGIVTTMTGTGGTTYGGDGGPATAAQIWGPYGVVTDDINNLYIADANNHRVRVVATKGSIGITLAGPTSVPTGTVITFTANASTTLNATYQWQKNGANVGSGLSTYTNSSPANGDVYRCLLNVTPECGSAYTDTSNSITVTVYGPPGAEPLETTIGAGTNKVSLYPNPAHSLITISSPEAGDGPATIGVFDQMGKEVMARQVTVAGGLKETLDVQGLPAGVYLVRLVEASGGITNLKFVKN
jgi:hypothetical protein